MLALTFFEKKTHRMSAVSLLENPIMTIGGVIWGYDINGSPVRSSYSVPQGYYERERAKWQQKLAPVVHVPSEKELDSMACMFGCSQYASSVVGDMFKTQSCLLRAVRYSWEHGVEATIAKGLTFFL